MILPEWLPTPDNLAFGAAVAQLDTVVYDIIAKHTTQAAVPGWHAVVRASLQLLKLLLYPWTLSLASLLLCPYLRPKPLCMLDCKWLKPSILILATTAHQDICCWRCTYFRGHHSGYVLHTLSMWNVSEPAMGNKETQIKPGRKEYKVYREGEKFEL